MDFKIVIESLLSFLWNSKGNPAMTDEKEKEGCAAAAAYGLIEDDIRHLAENRHKPFLKDGKVDIDSYIDFLNDYNEFINHMPKPFKPMKEKTMKL